MRRHPHGPRWARRLAWATLALGVLSLGLALLVRAWARPPREVGVSVPAPLRGQELALLSAAGLKVPVGGVVLERPFDPPWGGRSLVVPQRWKQPRLKVWLSYDASVRADRLLLDLDLLEVVMQRQYGGWDSARARGWDWGKWFGAWREQLRRQGTGTVRLTRAFAPIQALLAFQPDNHTQIPLQNFLTRSPSQTLLLAAPPKGPCTEVRRADGRTLALDPGNAAQQPRSALAAPAPGEPLVGISYLSVPAAFGDLSAAQCGERWVSLDATWQPVRSALSGELGALNPLEETDLPTLKRLSPEIAYARIPTLAAANYQSLETLRSTWSQPTRGEKALIVDLRNNAGGDVQLGLDVLEGWVDRQRLPALDGLGSRLAVSCLYPPLRWNLLTQGLGKANLPLARHELLGLQEALDALRAPYPPGCPREVRETKATWGYRAHRVVPHAPGRRLLVLVDNRCSAECELLASALAQLPEAVVVGTNTYGMAEFLQAGEGLLPHTRLPFRMSLGHRDVYGDGRSFDGYGLDVDVVLKEEPEWQLSRLAELAGKLLAL